MSEKNEEDLEKNNEEKIKVTKKKHNKIWLGIGAALGIAILGSGALYYYNYSNLAGQDLYGVPSASLQSNVHNAKFI